MDGQGSVSGGVAGVWFDASNAVGFSVQDISIKRLIEVAS